MGSYPDAQLANTYGIDLCFMTIEESLHGTFNLVGILFGVVFGVFLLNDSKNYVINFVLCY